MESLLTIKNLTLKLDKEVFFDDFNLKIPDKSITSIIASNKSGKSLLTKVISGIIPTIDKVTLVGISLNKNNVLTYITNIGVVSDDLTQTFLFKKVKDELAFPLHNLGYPEHKINKKITEMANFFEITDILNKSFNELSIFEKKKILFALALIHEPKLLILDDAFWELNTEETNFLLTKLSELNKNGLTILNITSLLDTIYTSQDILILEKYKIVKKCHPKDIFEDDNLLKKLDLTVPFIVDLSRKLKFYKLIAKIYFDLEELEGDLWK